MDFFEYAAPALQFVDKNTFYVPLIVGGICFLLVLIFQGIGLYVIAGREGYKNKWMAFVPFFNTYYLGVCGQKNRLFKSIDTKTIAMITAILEAVLFAGYLVYFIAYFQLAFNDCIKPLEQDSMYGPVTTYYLANVPKSLGWAAWCYEFLYSYILSWIEVIFLFLQVFVMSAFFQTYSARRYFLFTLFSVLFPIQGILVFILRNNRGMDYREYMRREQERQYRMYQQAYGQNYNNPYGYNNGGYRTPPQNSSAPDGKSPDDPFAEYGGKGGNDRDPFEN